ncbi:SLC13 family permease [Brevibacterium limosum]|uniref:SLC13 family permease n=1 Tax=Brevibacterium limosum TaxID=2697565 RepID=UPI0014220A6C|nr:SLC13 family permease [Brevibacterium limosum]
MSAEVELARVVTEVPYSAGVRERQRKPFSLRWNVIVPWTLVTVAVLTIVSGGLPGADVVALAETTGPVLIFVIAMTIVAELASAAGVFSVVAERLAVWGRGRRVLLWVFVLAMITLSTAFMSLDTTAVLITPVIVVLARHVGVSPLPYALATVWLANTASLFLPVSNLTNLLAADALGGTPLGFLAEFWAPALAAVLITVVALTLIHRRSLAGRYELAGTTAIPDRRLLIIAAVVVAVLLPMLVSGVPVALVAGVAALVLVAVFAFRRRSVLTLRLIPWQTMGIAASLFVIVEAIHVQGYDTVLGTAVGQGQGVLDLLRIAGIGALGANAVNNLPAYLSLSAFADTPLRLGALLIGVNLAPLISPWGSLATLLWHHRLTAMSVEISWRRFAVLGLGLSLVLVPVTTLALWLG